MTWFGHKRKCKNISTETFHSENIRKARFYDIFFKFFYLMFHEAKNNNITIKKKSYMEVSYKMYINFKFLVKSRLRIRYKRQNRNI